MSGAILNLIIQLVAGAIGGNVAGATLKDYNLGTLGNTIAGAIGGGLGGQLLQGLLPALASAGDIDAGAIIGQLAAGGVSGGVLTLLVGLMKTMMSNQRAH